MAKKTTAKDKQSDSDRYELSVYPGSDEKRRLVRTFKNGACVVKLSEAVAEAYDSAGRYLGAGSVAQAEEQARLERIVNLAVVETYSDLAVWSIWNDGLASGLVPLELPGEPIQLMRIAESSFIRAEETESGWSVDWLTDTEVAAYYLGDKGWKLRYAEKPFKLE